MTDLERAKSMLLSFPDQVFDLWVPPIVTLHGWPFDGLESPCNEDFKFYFCGLRLDQIAKLRWHREDFPFAKALFSPCAVSSMVKLADFHTPWMPKEFRQGIQVPDDSESRWESLRAFIEKEGKLPSPAVLFRQGDSFEIFDGYHRLAILMDLTFDRKVEGFHVECWVGEFEISQG